MDVQGEFDRFVGRFKGQDTGSGSEEEFPGEADFGLSEATADDIPTRVKVRPEKKTSTPPRSSTKLERHLATVKEGLEEQLYDLGVGAGEIGFTTAGYVVCDGAQAFSDALVEMARNKPRLLKFLERSSSGVNFSKIAKYAFAIYLAVMVDMESRDPYGFQMQYLGVTQAYEKTHPDGPATQQYQAPVFSAPPTFG